MDFRIAEVEYASDLFTILTALSCDGRYSSVSSPTSRGRTRQTPPPRFNKVWRIVLQTLSLFRGEIPSNPFHAKLSFVGEDNLTNPSPTKWGRIKEGAKRADTTEKSRWGFYCPPLNLLPQGGRGGGG